QRFGGRRDIANTDRRGSLAIDDARYLHDRLSIQTGQTPAVRRIQDQHPTGVASQRLQKLRRDGRVTRRWLHLHLRLHLRLATCHGLSHVASLALPPRRPPGSGRFGGRRKASRVERALLRESIVGSGPPTAPRVASAPRVTGVA